MKQKAIAILETDNLFLTGGAGTGKSYLTREIIRFYKQLGKGVVTLGSTGISAVNIGGYTIHSFFGFGICANLEELVAHDRKNKNRLVDIKKILQKTHLLIIDEISMVSAELLDMISYRVRSMGYTGRMMFVGDFFQLPPVQKDSGTSLFGDEIFAFESSAWELFAPKMLALTKMQRTKNRAFTKILQKIRLGYCDEKVKSYLLNLATHQPTADATYLYGTNYQADQKNRVELSQIEEQEHRLLAQEEKIKSSLSEKRVESWKRLLPISHELHIKVGAPILFTVNKYGKFYNGERGVIKAIEEEFLIVEKEEELIKVERHDFELTEVEIKPDGKLEDVTLFRVGQYPIKLAYAITIHKSQGMSIESLVCNIDKIFTPSQFYVAISRAMDPERLAIEYTQGAIEHYIDRIIQIDQKVLDFYRRVAFEAEGDTASGG